MGYLKEILLASFAALTFNTAQSCVTTDHYVLAGDTNGRGGVERIVQREGAGLVKEDGEQGLRQEAQQALPEEDGGVAYKDKQLGLVFKVDSRVKHPKVFYETREEFVSHYLADLEGLIDGRARAISSYAKEGSRAEAVSLTDDGCFIYYAIDRQGDGSTDAVWRFHLTDPGRHPVVMDAGSSMFIRERIKDIIRRTKEKYGLDDD